MYVRSDTMLRIGLLDIRHENVRIRLIRTQTIHSTSWPARDPANPQSACRRRSVPIIIAFTNIVTNVIYTIPDFSTSFCHIIVHNVISDWQHRCIVPNRTLTKQILFCINCVGILQNNNLTQWPTILSRPMKSKDTWKLSQMIVFTTWIYSIGFAKKHNGSMDVC